MKLLRLKINEKFRSLPKGFELEFLQEWNHDKAFNFDPYCLAGLNGSGKSNILEALAAIFYHIERTDIQRNQDHFKYVEKKSVGEFDSKKAEPNAFEIEYFFPQPDITSNHPSLFVGERQVVHIHIEKKANKEPKFSFVSLNVNEARLLDEIPESEINDYLPAYVLGYSSGHNEILNLPFSKMRFIHLDEYQNTLSRDLIYDGQPTGRSIFIDDQFSQAVLLCHYLFPTAPVLNIFKRETGLVGIKRFRIIIRRFHRIPFSEDLLNSLSSEEKEDINKTTVELTSKLDLPNNQFRLGLIKTFIKCATTYYEDRSDYESKGDYESCDLKLDFYIDPAEKDGTSAIQEAFLFHFGESENEDEIQRIADASLKLFRALQTLLTLNYYQTTEDTRVELCNSKSLYSTETIPIPASHERITRFKDYEIIKKGVNKKLYNRALSDGEYQLLHTIGLCLLFRHKPCLFLLDEPETHLNPHLRASYISILREAFSETDNQEPIMREVLITSHSPFVISDCQQENVLVFNKNKITSKVSCERPDFNTFGASSSLITNEIFNHKETIGDFSNSALEQLENEKGNTQADRIKIARKLDRTLGESIEKTLAISRILRGEDRT